MASTLKHPVIVRIFCALKRYQNQHRHRVQKRRSEHQNNERMMAQWARGVGLLTIALVIVGLITAAIFWRQLDVMRRQLNDSEVMEAASLSVRNFDVARFSNNSIVDFDMVDGGRTRADEVHCTMVINQNVPESIPAGDETKGLYPMPPSPSGFSMNPNDPPRHFVSKFENIKNNKNISFMLMCSYLDVFRKAHHIFECFISHADGRVEGCLKTYEYRY